MSIASSDLYIEAVLTDEEGNESYAGLIFKNFRKRSDVNPSALEIVNGYIPELNFTYAKLISKEEYEAEYCED